MRILALRFPFLPGIFVRDVTFQKPTTTVLLVLDGDRSVADLCLFTVKEKRRRH